MSSPAEICVQIEDRINGLIDALKTSYRKQYQSNAIPDYVDYEVVKGVKYYKVVMHTPAGNNQTSKSVHAFISRQTGAVYKPASWRLPAKHVRYSLLDDASYEDCLNRADWAGGYLYMK